MDLNIDRERGRGIGRGIDLGIGRGIGQEPYSRLGGRLDGDQELEDATYCLAIRTAG